MKSRNWLLVLMFAPLSAALPNCTDSQVASISPTELAVEEDVVILDVRTAEEFASGHIPGALHIPYQELATRSSEVPQDREVAVYCMVGPRARRGEQSLTEAGHTKLLHLEGGFSAWQAAGLPVDTDDEEPGNRNERATR